MGLQDSKKKNPNLVELVSIELSAELSNVPYLFLLERGANWRWALISYVALHNLSKRHLPKVSPPKYKPTHSHTLGHLQKYPPSSNISPQKLDLWAYTFGIVLPQGDPLHLFQ